MTKNEPSETVKRVSTGVTLAALLFLFWGLRGWPARIALMLVSALMIWEMYDAFAHKNWRPVRPVGLAFAAALLPTYFFYGVSAFPLVLALFFMAGLGAVILKGTADFESAVATVFPLLYPGMFMSLMYPLLDLEPRYLGATAFGLSFLIPVANDLAAYLVGVRYGKRRLCPELSPKKSVEGAVAGMAASLLVALLLPLAMAPITGVPLSRFPPLWHFACVGFLGGIASPLGDLTASLVKRHCDIKDFGHLLPGHGGVMDRLDSITFTAAVVYAYFAFFLKTI
ncbi:MAG: phosphatidate cytidylyltransferase [Clostridiales bacterium]|jgi:phosphatidate cytidylyltransferase|nr:phosphatidate cytidylyltransferase [Bacillota bacterium]NLL54298.1 phosphatidate cytidylyltransferase [Clostridiales bacterium]